MTDPTVHSFLSANNVKKSVKITFLLFILLCTKNYTVLNFGSRQNKKKKKYTGLGHMRNLQEA